MNNISVLITVVVSVVACLSIMVGTIIIVRCISKKYCKNTINNINIAVTSTPRAVEYDDENISHVETVSVPVYTPNIDLIYPAHIELSVDSDEDIPQV